MLKKPAIILWSALFGLLAMPLLPSTAHAYKWIGLSIPQTQTKAATAPAKKYAAPQTTPRAEPKTALYHEPSTRSSAAAAKEKFREKLDNTEIVLQIPKSYIDEKGDLKNCTDRQAIMEWLSKQPERERKKIMAKTVPVSIPLKDLVNQNAAAPDTPVAIP